MRLAIAAVLALATMGATAQAPAVACAPRAEFDADAFKRGYVLAWSGWVTPSLTEHRFLVYQHPDGRWVAMRTPPDGGEDRVCPFAYGREGESIADWVPDAPAPAPKATPAGTGPMLGA